MIRTIALSILILGLASFTSISKVRTGPASRPLAITHVTVIDATGRSAMPNMTVVIAGERITQIGTSAEVSVPRGAQVVNGAGKFLIPGLWDAHVHLSWTTASALPVLIANGVTTVRDMGGRLSELDDWRTKIVTGILAGPRILRAGPILNGQKFNQYQMVSGNPDETRGVIRALKEAGVDFIKVHRRMPRDSYFAAIDEAKKQGLTLVGHIPMTVTPAEASDAGEATIEHTETLFEGTFTAALKGRKLFEAIRQFRADAADELFARFVRNHTVSDPTLIAYRTSIDFSDPALPPNSNLRYVAVSNKKTLEQSKLPAADLLQWKQTFAELCEVVRQMHTDGVTLIAGTDIAGPRIPGFSLHEELALLVQCGLTPMQALQAATSTPARVLNKSKDLGTIEVGKLADLILVDANPLDDIHNTQRIRAVIVGGKLMNRFALDKLLALGETMAKQS
jgi:imidazolonepropionase-like amidohydrolase